MVNKTIFICMLPQKMQDHIESKIRESLVESGITENIEQIVSNAMSDRLCNLEDSIDINKLITELDNL